MACDLSDNKYMRECRMKKLILSVVFGNFKCKYTPFNSPGWDKKIVTDNAANIEVSSDWIITIRNKEHNDPRKSNRYYKWCAFKVFPEYDIILYLDSRVQLKNTPATLEKINHYADEIYPPRKASAIFFKHPLRKCLYREAVIVRHCKLEKEENIDDFVSMLEKKEFPTDYGLTENNLFLIATKNEPFHDAFEHMWEIISEKCRRDQVLFMYIVWVYNLKNHILFKTNAEKKMLFDLNVKQPQIIPREIN